MKLQPAVFSSSPSVPLLRRGLRRALIALSLLALAFYGCASRAGGTEQCANCGFEREARRIGPVWARFDTQDACAALRVRLRIVPCEQHDWEHTGCWYEDGAILCGRSPFLSRHSNAIRD